MEINLTPEDVVKMSKNKVDECFDIFKEPLNLEEATSLINAILPQLEQMISNTLEEQIYDDLMDKNGLNDIETQYNEQLERKLLFNTNK